MRPGNSVGTLEGLSNLGGSPTCHLTPPQEPHTQVWVGGEVACPCFSFPSIWMALGQSLIHTIKNKALVFVITHDIA